MATTTNYGWTTPDDTALVKDGAAAIRSLGTAIDTSMNTALGTKKAGMILLTSASFSAVSGISLPTNTFTSTYRNYKFMIDVYGASISGTYTMRLRTSGTDNSNANYQSQIMYGTSTTVSASRSTNQTAYTFNSINTNRNFYDLTIYSPQTAEHTLWFAAASYNPSTTSLEVFNYAGGFNATTQFDSLSWYSSGANITGFYRVYGFNE